MKSKNKVIGIMLVAILGITILFFTNVNFAANTAKVNVETANLRETADENSKILVQLSLNDNVEVLDNSSDWCKVKSNDITGYVRKDLLTLENSTEDQNEISTTKTEENTSSNSETTTQNTSTEQEEQTTEITNEQIVKENTKGKTDKASKGVRVVINAVSLETIAQITKLIQTYPVKHVQLTQIQASRAHKLGSYNLMPVLIASFNLLPGDKMEADE